VGAVLTALSPVLVDWLKPEAAYLPAQAQAVGLMLVGMVGGQACEVLSTRIRRLSALSHYHQTRLAQFTSTYHLLKVSHAQLEQRVAGGTHNLRNALERLKQREPQLRGQGGGPLGGLAEEVLDIMVEQGDLYTAAVYALNERGLLRLPALARAGNAPELSMFNPLLRETLRTGLLTSVQAGGEAGYDHVIAVVPLVDSSDHIHAVVAIHDMPFLAVNPDTFGLLGVLGKHIGDILAQLTRPVDAAGSVASLRDSLQRHLTDARRHAIPSALLACRIVDATRRDALVALCTRSGSGRGRGLDQSWVVNDRQGHPVILKLLPLIDQTGAGTLMKRLQRARVGGQPAKSGMTNALWMLDQYRHADALLAEVCLACGIDNLEAAMPQVSGAGAVV
jgi:hypothetical protein